MKTKRMIVVIAIFVLCLFALFSCSEQYEYNTDIDTNKPNGSFSKMATLSTNNLYGVIDHSDVIIIGEIISSEPYSEPFAIGGEGSGEGYTDVALTKTKVKVNETLYGKVNSSDEDNTISFVQLGQPGDDSTTIKPKTNDKVVMFLTYDEKNDYYGGISFEQCIFYIRDDGLYTYCNLEEFGKYDGTPLELLKRDIADIIKDNDMTPENNFAARAKAQAKEEATSD